jgi:hypothetical protein
MGSMKQPFQEAPMSYSATAQPSDISQASASFALQIVAVASGAVVIALWASYLGSVVAGFI